MRLTSSKENQKGLCVSVVCFRGPGGRVPNPKLSVGLQGAGAASVGERAASIPGEGLVPNHTHVQVPLFVLTRRRAIGQCLILKVLDVFEGDGGIRVFQAPAGEGEGAGSEGPGRGGGGAPRGRRGLGRGGWGWGVPHQRTPVGTPYVLVLGEGFTGDDAGAAAVLEPWARRHRPGHRGVEGAGGEAAPARPPGEGDAVLRGTVRWEVGDPGWELADALVDRVRLQAVT